MRLFIANDSKQSLGGGWSFIRNFKKGLKTYNNVQIVETIEECDVFFIPSSTMVLKENVERARELKKVIILRVDNIPKDSRNRGTGWARLRKYAAMANRIIYQSEWAQNLLSFFIGKGIVIYNGVDTDIFNDKNKNIIPGLILYSRYNRDESKGWIIAYYEFIKAWQKDKTKKLRIVGNFSNELIQYHFDFPEEMWNSISYGGIIETPEQMAHELKQAEIFYAPYLYDACSNSILEALACKMRIYITNNSDGSSELFNLNDLSLTRMTREYLEAISVFIAIN